MAPMAGETWSLATALGFALAGAGAIASSLGLVLLKASHGLAQAPRRRRLWCVGTLVLCTINPLCDVVALGLAPLSLLSPLGAVAVIASLVLSRYILHVRPSLLQWALALAATAGVSLASAAGPHDDAMPSVEELDLRLMHLSALWPILVVVFAMVTMGANSPRARHALVKYAGRTLGLVTAIAAGLVGGVSALFVKMILQAAEPLARGDKTFVQVVAHPSTMLAVALLIPAAALQLLLLNAALAQSALAAAAPVYQVTFSMCVLFNGATILKETDDMGRARLAMFGAGMGLATVTSFALGLLRAEPHVLPRASPLAVSDGLDGPESSAPARIDDAVGPVASPDHEL